MLLGVKVVWQLTDDNTGGSNSQAQIVLIWWFNQLLYIRSGASGYIRGTFLG